MLHGRGEELERLRRVADDTRAFAGRALLVRGEPGIGKSALLLEGRLRAAADGLRVLAMRGIELEAILPFAALSALLLPLAARFGELPPMQASLLAGALGFAAPLPSDPFAVAAAALNLLGIVSTDEPLLLVCDDAHWLDPASATALLFISGRLTDQAISVVVAVRPDTRSFDPARFETLDLAGLSSAPGRELIAERFGDTIAPAVAGRLVTATGGNPLALLEVPELLTERQRAGLDQLAAPLPVGEATSDAYRLQIARLPAATRQALVVAAAADDDYAVLVEALALLGLDRDALAPAEAAGLVRHEGTRLEFRHALVRSVAHHDASLAEQQAAHRALAAAQPDEIRRAWHLEAVATGPDEETAAALELAAMHAMTRSGFSEASAAFSHAADRSTDPEARARRQLGAAQTAVYAGDLARAQMMIAAALEDPPDAQSRARAVQIRGRTEIWWPTRPLTETALRLAEESRAIEDADPDIALAILFDAVFALIASGAVGMARTHARHALGLAQRTESGALLAEFEVMESWIAILGSSEDDAIRRMASLRDRVDRSRPEAAQLGLFLEVPVIYMGDTGAFLGGLAGAIEGARSAAALIPLAMLLAVRADGEIQMGRLQLAETDAVEAIALSPPGSSSGTYANLKLAFVEALTGAEDSCRARVEKALPEAAAAGAGALTCFGQAALAQLEQTLGNDEAAFERMLANAEFEARLGLRNPLMTTTTMALVETSARLGRLDVAARWQAEHEESAAILRVPALFAFAAHGRGLLARGDDYPEHFEEAIAQYDRAGRRFDRARAQLAFGERLRRSRRRIDARRVLRAAIETFDEAGSEPWAERARQELRATGETTHPRVAASRTLLTPQELQVARHASEGLSNPEIASRLFISPKTVEKHLGATFRKLNIASRRELIREANLLLDT